MIRRLVLLVALTPLVALAQSATTYVVQPGDTLYRISRAHDLTVDRLRALNGIDGTYISVGQTLRLTDRVSMPAQTAPPPGPVEGVGESIPTLPRPETPRPPVVTPVTPAPPPARGPAAGGVVHVVTAGETLFRIALNMMPSHT